MEDGLKKNDHYAPRQIGEAFCYPFEAVDVECWPP